VKPGACVGIKEGVVMRIVILGAGFGGLYTALRLEQLLPRDGSVEVTVVNRDNFFLFTPMLHEVAASDLDITHIVSPIRALLRKSRFVCGDVIGIDVEARSVEVRHGLTQHQHLLMYDHLVLALGSTTNFYNLPGLESHALTMKSLGDAIQIRNRLIAHLEEADSETSTEARQMLLTFVVAGGGFAGVETMAAINDFVREALDHYPKLDASLVRMVLVHAAADVRGLESIVGRTMRTDTVVAGFEVECRVLIRLFGRTQPLSRRSFRTLRPFRSSSMTEAQSGFTCGGCGSSRSRRGV
jgi:NADH dehydrogenase FAD-containing subunit